jgi:hypothetical protein
MLKRKIIKWKKEKYLNDLKEKEEKEKKKENQSKQKISARWKQIS